MTTSKPQLFIVADAIHFECPCESCAAERAGEPEYASPAVRGIVFSLPISIMGWLLIAVALHFCRFV